MTTSIRAGALACALLATTALSTPALAQSAGLPSIHKNIDDNGVDLTDGTFNFSMVEGSIGAGENALALVRHSGRGGWRDDIPTHLRRHELGSTAELEAVLGNKTEIFRGPVSATSFDSSEGNGARLTIQTNGDYLYTAADGTVTRFGLPPGVTTNDAGGTGPLCTGSTSSGCELLALSTTFPNGRQISYEWDVSPKCEIDETGEAVCRYFYRMRKFANNSGYSVRFGFVTEPLPSGSAPPPESWYQRSGAAFHNSAAGTGTLASVSYTYPDPSTTIVTDTGGRSWTFSHDTNLRLTGIKRPGAGSATVSISRDANGKVSQVAAEGVTTNYAYGVSGSEATMTVTDALGAQEVVVSDLNLGRPVSAKDALGRTTSFAYDASGRPTKVTAPEGNAVAYGYDARGNVVETRALAKPGSGAADIVAKASFPADCANVVTCNKPLSTTDPQGNVTDYVWDGTHGGLVRVTLPAAPNGVRPQTRYAYTLTNGLHMLTAVSACQTQASCAGTADEVKTTIAYGTNNLPTSTSAGAGDGSLTAASTMSYDFIGNLLSVDGPLAGSEDTVRFRYDAARQRVGAVSPDPDGAGPLKHRAQRNTFNRDGQVTKVENGTVADQTDAAWTNFASLEAAETGYDANARPVTTRLVAGGTTHALVQTSYDALGRPECSAQRMNPNVFGSLPASACTLGEAGSFGPDRIAKTVYNAAGQAIEVRTAVGTTLEAAEATSTYTSNGQVQTLTDGENNRTSYAYDGHDRLIRTNFPVATKGALASSSTDYEELGYDAGSNVTSRRLRDGQVIAFSYDALGRMTLKDLPGTEPDVSYAHDLLGRMTLASTSGRYVELTYDALSRLTRERTQVGYLDLSYDAAGRMVRISQPVNEGARAYDHLVTGEVSRISEGGGFVVATFGYDDLGRRTSLAYGNGTGTSYGYDAASRLTSLAHDLAGTAHDQTVTLSYNPAGQIISRTGSNDAYAYTSLANATIGSTVNGLNQLTQVGSAAVTHDPRGNTTSDGVKSYSYTSENRLATAGTASLDYNPLGQLNRWSGGAVDTNYAGAAMVVERNGGNLTERHYVHGPGMDEPLVWYEGNQYSGDRRYLHADERGSIVAVSDNNGNALAINKYDEYGTPASTNVGRFQYTGQIWMPEVGLYDYKARAYDPGKGRFMQTDPIGYDDGMNLYAYVGGDPVNFTDPWGLRSCPTEICSTGRRIAPRERSGVSKAGNQNSGPSTGDSVPRHFEPDPRGPEEQSECGTPGADPYNCTPVVIGRRLPRLTLIRTTWVETPSLDPFTFFKHYTHGQGETVCLTRQQFRRVVETGRIVGTPTPNGRNLVTYYGGPLENTFGTATLIHNGGKPVGFYDKFDFNLRGAQRSFEGHVKTFLGSLLGGTPFDVRFPC